MNYFNYFTEIEDAFVRRRGKHVLLSPLDWALIESWKEKGVPLHIALNGIERAFDSYEARPRKRSVKSLLYCQEEVEAQHGEWLESQVGAQGEASSNGDHAQASSAVDDAQLPFPRADILKHLLDARAQLLRVCEERKLTRPDQLCETLTRAAAQLEGLEKDFARARRPQAERLETSLTGLEKMLNEALRSSVTTAELAAARAATAAQLEPYSRRMERATYEQTFDNLLLKRLRDEHHLPRLSLFYL
ncbi:MAG: hypothetical protein QOF02_251 [Blastocatellia bacterium]|jgi:hypothetical protein|nr:hypothetical protein [Blastocatellia bacterium]